MSEAAIENKADEAVSESLEKSDDREEEEQTTVEVPELDVTSTAQSSSEHFKLEIRNLPKNFAFGQLRKFLTQLNLKFVKLKSPGNSSFAFVTFVNEEARVHAKSVLNGVKYKGKQLEAIYSNAVADPLIAKRNNNAVVDENGDGESKTKHVKLDEDDEATLREKVQNATTPLWNLTYDQQIAQKAHTMKQYLRKCALKIEKTNSVLFYWLQKQQKENDGMCCPLVDVVRSPVIDHYRNKCEFSIGYDNQEKNSVIGFRLGDYKSGSVQVVDASCCKHISDQMKWLLVKFKEYIDQSEHKAFNVRTKVGHWRQLTIRSNLLKELLAIIVFDKQELSDTCWHFTKEQIAKEKQLLVAYFTRINESQSESSGFTLKSLFFNLNTNKTGISKMDNIELLLGEDCLYENLLDLKFRVSPLAFFQANTKAAEQLYSKIGDICDVDANTVILDVCCGTGTIGMTLAKRAKIIIGVDIVAEAIEDAKLNSSLNGLTNVEYYCGKAEDVLPGILRRFKDDKVIVILDPPRAGLHAKVVQSLRRMDNLHNLIYVSCNPELAATNFVDLARESSKTYWGEAFVPVKAIAFDLFPHCGDVELVLYFKRYSSELFSSSKQLSTNNNTADAVVETAN